jgi:CubicO group peptidase (beta-lactamase class C family)
MTLREVLTHQSGMAGWIAFYAETMKNGMPDPLVYSKVFDQEHSIQVADNMYIMASYRDSIYQTIAKVRNYPVKRYKYSDLGFYLFHEIIEDKTQTGLSEYVNKTFYEPMGAWSMSYTPLKQHKRENIVPTEDDQYFRHQLLQGHVHDYGAAMLGGVAGHAGLFSNANDLAKMSQMLLWNGQYGNEHFLDSATIALFTSCQYCPENRRGLGFDKPQGDTSKISPTCEGISLKSYGHTGFTGTMVWADPEKDLVYVFLSNRIHPDQRNSKLIKMDIRTRIQKVLYDAIEQYRE